MKSLRTLFAVHLPSSARKARARSIDLAVLMTTVRPSDGPSWNDGAAMSGPSAVAKLVRMIDGSISVPAWSRYALPGTAIRSTCTPRRLPNGESADDEPGDRPSWSRKSWIELVPLGLGLGCAGARVVVGAGVGVGVGVGVDVGFVVGVGVAVAVGLDEALVEGLNSAGRWKARPRFVSWPISFRSWSIRVWPVAVGRDGGELLRAAVRSLSSRGFRAGAAA